MLATDGGRSQGLTAGTLAMGRGLSLDLSDEPGHELAILLLREMSPAGQRRKDQDLRRREAHGGDGLSPAPSGVLLRLVEPVALRGFPRQQGLSAVDARPVQDLFDQPLFDPMRQDISQSLRLGGGLGADHDGLVSPGPDLLPPTDQAADLARQVGVDVPHELRELERVADVQNQVEVIAQEAITTDAYRVLPLGPAQDTDDDVLDLLARAKEETALEGSADDLDEGAAFGDIAGSSHGQIRRKKPRIPFNPCQA